MTVFLDFMFIIVSGVSQRPIISLQLSVTSRSRRC